MPLSIGLNGARAIFLSKCRAGTLFKQPGLLADTAYAALLGRYGARTDALGQAAHRCCFLVVINGASTADPHRERLPAAAPNRAL